jgi:hypothetical protein
MKHCLALWLVVLSFFTSCQNMQMEEQPRMFKDDLKFLRKHTDIAVLSDESGQSQVIISPEMQGRVLTSTASGPDGIGFGWINRDLIASGENNPHFNAFGGEDRFWMGPEGGQFSIFHKSGGPFDLDNWYTPAEINEVAYDVVQKSDKSILLKRDMKITNYSGFTFDVGLLREIRLISASGIGERLGITLPTGIKSVAFESENKISNTGRQAWDKETGLLSIWILGMFNPSPQTTVVIPFKPGDEEQLGPIVNDTYFGKIAADRLGVRENIIYFKGDGKSRGKLGLSPKRCTPIMGSYDASNKVLTLVTFSFNEKATDYVNSMWEIQNNPYSGDVINSYNDGPPSPGADPLGPFYELETSSRAAALAPGESLSHLHSTFHFTGEEIDLDRICRETLGTTIEKIITALN